MTETENSPNSEGDFTWARAFRDIGVSAINTGQFPFFCLFAIALLILLKMPGEDISTLVNEVFHNFKSYALSGYTLFAVTLLFGGIYIKILRNAHKKQIAKRDSLIKTLNGSVVDTQTTPVAMLGDAG